MKRNLCVVCSATYQVRNITNDDNILLAEYSKVEDARKDLEERQAKCYCTPTRVCEYCTEPTKKQQLPNEPLSRPTLQKVYNTLQKWLEQPYASKDQLKDLMRDIEVELYANISKKSGKADLFKLINNFLVDSKKNNPYKPASHVVTEIEGMFYFNNGVVGYQLHEIPEGLPMFEGDEKFRQDRLFSSIDDEYKTLDIDLDKLKNACKLTLNNVTVEDDIITNYIYGKKGTNPAIIVHNGIKHGFNPRYMLDALKILTNPKISVAPYRFSAIVVTGDNGRCLILPVKLPEDDE